MTIHKRTSDEFQHKDDITSVDVTESRDIVDLAEASPEEEERLQRLPPHLRAAARRSWSAREEDYRYLIDR